MHGKNLNLYRLVLAVEQCTLKIIQSIRADDGLQRDRDGGHLAVNGLEVPDDFLKESPFVLWVIGSRAALRLGRCYGVALYDQRL
jgi:hypothetical protein